MELDELASIDVALLVGVFTVTAITIKVLSAVC